MYVFMYVYIVKEHDVCIILTQATAMATANTIGEHHSVNNARARRMNVLHTNIRRRIYTHTFAACIFEKHL